MGLSAKIINLVRLNFIYQLVDGAGVGQVTIVQAEHVIFRVRVLINVLNPPGVKGGGAAHNPMDFVALFEQQLREIAPVLSGHAEDQGLFYGCWLLVVSHCLSVVGSWLWPGARTLQTYLANNSKFLRRIF